MTSEPVPAGIDQVMQQSLAVLQRHRAAGTLRGDDDKNSATVVRELGQAGYWGLLVKPEFGGSDCRLSQFFAFLTRAATVDAPFAGLASVHGCIGAVDPLQTFGTQEQQQRYLPKLARGERLSAFASTEPSAGSDLRRIRTRAERRGDQVLLTGQKAFTTNLAPGRTIGLLCRHEEQLAVAIVDLPERESGSFRLVPNPVHPLRHTVNQGVRFESFAIPPDALLTPPSGKDGLAIVYHGLNRGRSAIAALAAGHLRTILAGMLGWAKFRQVQGRSLASHELVQGRIARLVALIAGCDLLARWCGDLLDAGGRCEVEAMIAKIFASEGVREATFQLALPTHGGRFFLKGHPTGDLAYDYLAPCIYEGENELLSLALVHSLKRHAQPTSLPASDGAGQADDWLRAIWSELASDGAARPAQQLAMLELSRRVQCATVATLVTANRSLFSDSLFSQAADVLLRQLRRQLTGARPSASDFAAEASLGAAVLHTEPNPQSWLGDWPAVPPLLPYEQA